MLNSVLFEIEIDEVAEPKTLLGSDLLALVQQYGSFVAVARIIGASEAFVRQNLRKHLTFDKKSFREETT